MGGALHPPRRGRPYLRLSREKLRRTSGVPLRKGEPNWRNRAMQFTDLGSGDINMVRYVEMLINIGYPARYMKVNGTDTAPLIAETESNYRDPDATAIEGIQYVRDNLCFPVAEGSFEDEMGA